MAVTTPGLIICFLTAFGTVAILVSLCSAFFISLHNDKLQPPLDDIHIGLWVWCPFANIDECHTLKESDSFISHDFLNIERALALLASSISILAFLRHTCGMWFVSTIIPRYFDTWLFFMAALLSTGEMGMYRWDYRNLSLSKFGYSYWLLAVGSSLMFCGGMLHWCCARVLTQTRAFDANSDFRQALLASAQGNLQEENADFGAPHSAVGNYQRPNAAHTQIAMFDQQGTNGNGVGANGHTNGLQPFLSGYESCPTCSGEGTLLVSVSPPVSDSLLTKGEKESKPSESEIKSNGNGNGTTKGTAKMRIERVECHLCEGLGHLNVIRALED